MQKSASRWTYAVIVLMLILAIVCLFALYGVLYPLRYKQEILQEARRYRLQPQLVAAVINTESRFDSKAVSRAGAKGLMQLLPSTAEWICQNTGREYYEGMLFEPQTNIALGAYYLSYLLNKFGDVDLALAAYNAGEGTVRQWMQNEQIFDGQKLFDVPYKETHDYLARVSRAKNVYTLRLA